MSYFLIHDLKNPERNPIRVEYAGPDSTDLYTSVSSIVGDLATCLNGQTIAVEADGWGGIACIGETFDAGGIHIELLEDQQ